MTRNFGFITAFAAMLAMAVPAAAQQDPGAAPAPAGGAAATDTAAKDEQERKASAWKEGRPPTIQYIRFMDQRGLNQFETSKDPGVEFTAFKLDFNAAFTAQVQNLEHQNTALPSMVIVSGYANSMYDQALKGWGTRTFCAKTHTGVKVETLWFNFEPPKVLHDARYLGEDFGQRQTNKRRIQRLQSAGVGGLAGQDDLAAQRGKLRQFAFGITVWRQHECLATAAFCQARYFFQGG